MRKFQKIIVTAFLGVVLLASGCATSQNMLGKEFTKETIANSKTYFSQVYAVADDNELMVSGKLRLKGSFGTNVPDFVEVALVDGAGKVIESRKVAYYPRVLSGSRKHREARFTTRFSEKPPAGTIIQVSNVN
jgi:hypothetical protein